MELIEPILAIGLFQIRSATGTVAVHLVRAINGHATELSEQNVET
jgi:hypothetical protein